MGHKDHFKKNYLFYIAAVLLIFISLITNYYGSIDTSDYSDSAKFFSGQLSSKIRSSHSYFFGFLHSPFVSLTKSFFIFKITSLIFLFLIILSIYKITNNKKALWLIFLSPVIWYMAPWISPIQLSALILLWAYYFIHKYNETNELIYLAYSGILIGLGWNLWDSVFFFGMFLALCFLINKKLYHSFYFALFLFMGLIPRLILDSALFGFPFYTILKNLMGVVSNIQGGIYAVSGSHTPKTFANLVSIFLAIPQMFWILYSPKKFLKNKKTMFFLTLSILLIIANPQIRYVLIILPIIVLIMSKNISKKQFKLQLVLSFFIILLFVFPYIVQTKYSINNQIEGAEFNYLFSNNFKLDLNKDFPKKLIKQDLKKITEKYPNSAFVTGNKPDDYQILASVYWDDNVKEFVSIQDYNLYFKNNSVLYEKTLVLSPKIKDRRQIRISGGLEKNKNDHTDYESIKYAIGLAEEIDLENFELVEKHNILYLSIKK